MVVKKPFFIFHMLLNSSSSRRIIILPEPGYPVYKSWNGISRWYSYANPLKKEKGYIFDLKKFQLKSQIKLQLFGYVTLIIQRGAVINKNKMETIYEWACKHEIIILSDECYIDMY